MKTIVRSIGLILVSLTIFVACKSTDPLVKQKAIEEIDNKIAEQRYTFTANHALPMSGRSINLTSSYSLEVSPDTIKAHLPYFGRAYSAPNPTSEGGIKFTSTNFDYQLSPKDKGTYRISIEIKDHPDHYKLSAIIGDNGSGTIYVTQKDKQGISFRGIIK